MTRINSWLSFVVLLAAEAVGFVVVGVWGDVELGGWGGLEFFEDDCDASFELLVVAGGYFLGQVFDGHVGGDAVVLDFPLAVEAVDAETRGHDAAAVDE